MPAKWSRPVFSCRFYEGKISRALIVSDDFRDLRLSRLAGVLAGTRRAKADVEIWFKE
jgi:hypothetical protein